mmetsp:Transcript_121986/g.193305  ORF Transcript_121986/g.193305 Transcript_121986/m.193305 type:complete len:525 (+) Transcript_121986:73-1647(+)
MTGGGLALPCPIYKYRRMPWKKACGIATGASGFSVSRHVHITFSNGGVKCTAFALKTLIYIFYAWYVGLYHKNYLDFAGHLDGVSRLQLQHPVVHCNPLTPDEGGCPTNFRNISDLDYCSQSPKAHKSSQKCRYFDEFDMTVHGALPGKTIFVPTRVTTYEQDINCSKDSLIPCPRTIELKKKETVYAADVESFTVLVDHSFLSDDLNVEMCSWTMLGFINPCGLGAEVDERMFASERDTLKKNILSVRQARRIDCSNEKNRQLTPIVPSEKIEEKTDSKQDIEKRHKGTAMWLSRWYQTLCGALWTPSYEQKMEEAKKSHRISPFTKLTNGDFIKIGDLLELAGSNLEVDDNRYEGLVIILHIEYANTKENSWPNNVPPAYFYSAWIAPADEYKAMQERVGKKRFTSPDGKRREIEDTHGIFIIVKQGGHIGVFSFAKIAVLAFIFMAIDSLYRSLFLCCAFNCNFDYGLKRELDESNTYSTLNPTQEDQLEDKVTFEFELVGSQENMRSLLRSSKEKGYEGV